MADSSLNPEDKAQLGRLERGLSELEGDLGRRLEALRRGVAADQQRVAREAGRAAHEETVRRTATGASPRTVIPTEAEVRRVAQSEIEAGEAVDRRARAFERITRFNVQTSQEQLNVMGRTEALLRMERDLGIQRARNLQLLQRQAQQLGVALPGQTTRGIRGGATQVGEFGFRPPAPALMLPGGEEYTAQRKMFDRLARAFESLGRGGGPSVAPPSYGRGGGRTPPPPRPPAPPGGGGPDEPDDPQRSLRQSLESNKLVDYARRLEDAANGNDDLARATQKSGAALKQMEARVSESSRTLAIGSNQMRAHGALTTEFIAAAAKGQTTFSELGYQAGATIAKFAGWTGAAAAVYGVLGAIQNLGSGAVESLQGVNLLQRVINNLDTDRAQRDFRQLAEEFNLPISEVVQTSFEASKAFKDQTDAMEATRAALFGVKVGELDAAKAGQFATAVARGFHLEAKQLGDVIDTVNALQNRFGGNFGSIAQGMGQAAGAFGAARGNYQQLAAAIATVSQVTGIQGPNAATALRRTSELAFRPERRAGILDVLGIDTRDASTSIADLLDAAMREVDKGRNPLEVAKLITTPELASRAIAPLIASGALYRQRLAVAQDPGPSSQRELNRARQSIRDQMSMIGNQLEQFGSNLAQSGALNMFGAVLKGINESLELANNLLEAFNALPKPVREAAMYFGQIAAALALMRRFDVGRTIGQRFPFAGEALGRGAVAGGRAQILQGLGDERRWLQEQTQAVGRQRALAELQAVRAAQRHDRNVDLHASGRLSDEELVRSMQRRDRYIAQAKDLAEDQADLQQRQNVNLQQEKGLRERTNFRHRATIRNLEDLDRAAKAQGILYRNPTLDRNVPESAVPLGAGRRIVDEDPDRAARRAARAASEEIRREPPIPWQQASGRLDVGAYHAATMRDLEVATKRHFEARRAAETFERGGGDPQELARLREEERKASLERVRAWGREQEARQGLIVGTRIPPKRDLDIWARDNAIGEPIPMPPEPEPEPPRDRTRRASGLVFDEATGSWLDAEGNVAKEGDKLARRQNTLRGNVARQTQVWQRWTAELRKSGEPMGRLSTALGAVGGAGETLANGARNVGTGVAAMGRNLANAIDPITGIIAGFLIVESSYSYIRQKVQQSQRTIDTLNRVGTDTPRQMRAQAERELGQKSLMDRAQGAFASIYNSGSLPGIGFITRALPDIQSPDEAEDEAARRRRAESYLIERANRSGVALTRGQITGRLNERLREAGDDQTAIAKAFADASKEAGVARGILFASSPADLRRAQRNIKDFQAGLKARQAGLQAIAENLDEALKLALDPDALQTVFQSVQTNIGLYGFSGGRAADLGKVRAHAVTQLATLNRGDPDYDANRQKYLAIIQGTGEEATKRAQDRIARSAPYLDPEAMAQIRQREIAKQRRTLLGGTEDKIDVVTQRMLRRQRQINKAQEYLDTPHPAALQGGVGGGLGTLGQLPGGAAETEEDKRKALEALKASQENDRKRLEELRKSLKMSREEFKDFLRAQELAQFEASQAAFEQTTNVLQSRTPDTSQDLAIAAQRAQQAYERAKEYRRTHTAKRGLVQDAEAKRNEANQALALDAVRDQQANDQLATAQAEAGGLKDKPLLERQLADAKRNAARVKAAVGQGKLDPDAYRDALLNVAQAETALRNFTQQNADSLLNALEALALSRTEDPNKQAAIRVDYARRRLAEAMATGTKEQQITAHAELNNRIRDKRQTAQQERFDEIEFMSSMEQIGKSTEISMLNNLLATMHGNRTLRRTIKQRIHDLQKTDNSLDSSDLTLGNIRLPTPYEVNRAIKEGGRASRGGHTFNSHAEVNVFVARSEDADHVARAIDRTLNTHVASVLRTRTR